MSDLVGLQNLLVQLTTMVQIPSIYLEKAFKYPETMKLKNSVIKCSLPEDDCVLIDGDAFQGCQIALCQVDLVHV